MLLDLASVPSSRVRCMPKSSLVTRRWMEEANKRHGLPEHFTLLARPDRSAHKRSLVGVLSPTASAPGEV